MKSLVEYALQYAAKGFYVLPMVKKRPLIEFADKPPLTADDIRYIWKHHPYANIALRTVQFFVIDIDRNHNDNVDGMEAINQLKNEHPNIFSKTLAQSTYHGGMQLLYRKPKNLQLTQMIGWLPGVDIKAHINNYVMIAPSEIDGKKYHFLNHENINYPSDELLKVIQTSSSTNNSDFKPSSFNYSGSKTRTTELFEEIVNGFGDIGSRNNKLTKFVGGLFYRNVDVDVAYELAKQANANTPDPLPIKELDQTFNSMMKKENRRREAAMNGN